MRRNKSTSLASNLFALAGIFQSIATTGAHLIGNFERAQRQKQHDYMLMLKAQNMALKNELTAEKIKTQENVTKIKSNDVVKGDQAIEKGEIELLFLKEGARKAGLLKQGSAPALKFTAQNYAEPYDVRRGLYPPPEEVNATNKF